MIRMITSMALPGAELEDETDRMIGIILRLRLNGGGTDRRQQR